MTLIDQRLCKRNHARHVLRRARFVIGTQDVESIVILVHRRNETLGENIDRLAKLRRTADDLVVDIGDIAYEDDLVPAMQQITTHGVEGHFGARVTDVTKVVDRIAAEIHPQLTGTQGDERLLLSRQRIMDLDHVPDSAGVLPAKRAKRSRARARPIKSRSGASSGP